VFRPPLLGRTLIGILLGAVPLLGTWGSGKWLLPWADATRGGDAATTQALWALGAVLGSAAGGWLADRLGWPLFFTAAALAALPGLSLAVALSRASARAAPPSPRGSAASPT